MPRSPAFRFYASDFVGSPAVQAMDLYEVGAYVFLLCAAWQSERHGYLPDDDDKLRRWAHLTREQWIQSRDILLAKFPIVEAGWRANPRMVLEAAKQIAYSESQSAKGKKGGRPKKAGIKPVLSDEKPGAFENISPEKASVAVTASVCDTASVCIDKNSSAPAEPHPEAALAGNKGEFFLYAWNGNRGSLPEAKSLTSTRRKQLATRVKDGLNLEDFTSAVKLASRTPFCRGENDRKWRLSFDFILKPDSVVRVLEGKYGEPDPLPRTVPEMTITEALGNFLPEEYRPHPPENHNGRQESPSAPRRSAFLVHTSKAGGR